MTSPSRTPIASLFAAALGVCLLLAGACSGESGESDEAMKARLERQAAARPKKAGLKIGVIHDNDGAAPDGPLAVDLEDGTELRIEQAHLVVSAVEVHACEPGRDDYESPGEPLLNQLWPLIGGTAHAHVPDSSTRMGTPFVEDLLGEPDRARIVGEIAPPLAAYCRLYAVVAPADADVVNTTGLSTDAIAGHSLLVRGRKRTGPEADWQPFTITSDLARPVELEAIDPNTGNSPLVLESPDATAMVLIDKTIAPAVFAVHPEAKDAGKTIIRRLADRMRVHRYD